MTGRALWLIALAACSQSPPKVFLVDAARMDGPECAVSHSTCNPIAQLGCNADERCTWLPSRTDPRCGLVGCTFAGQRALGETCAFVDGPVVSHDDCARGGVCVRSICRAICDINGGTTVCPGRETCTAEPNVFTSGTTTVAGVCE